MKNSSSELVDRNKEDRMEFISLWANYVRTHPDKDWSRQQKILIDSQMKRKHNITRQEYLKIKGEFCE
jgi:hypothetical protein